MSNKISIKSIGDLLQYNFFIPSYQRGYRWTEEQTKDLLDDVWEFVNKQDRKDSEWYCLQPIIVKNNENKVNSDLTGDWHDVIDGQQRLSTIFLMLKHLERFIESERKSFNIQYETRKDSESFLKNIESKTENDSKNNVDYFHIYRSYKTIKGWFQTKANDGHSSISSKFITPLLEKVKIIWYETSEDSIDIFTRINSGKIPLTDAELIKALFLNSSNFKNADQEKLRLKQLEIASEWDRIEYALQDDAFWYFINKEENNLETRIEFIFNLMTEEQETDDSHKVFRFFNNKFKTKTEEEVNNNWQEIKKSFQTLEEWFKDRELYHKIGYLISIQWEIKDILHEVNELSKTAFKNWLDQQIRISIEGLDIENLQYKNKEVRKVLLLSNIQTMLDNENETNLFPFDRYKKEHWDVEHIHAIATEVKVKKENQSDWLKNNFVKTDKHTDADKNSQIDIIISQSQSINENEFLPLVEYVLGEEDNFIKNLCLLDRGTNRSYKNDAFKGKRKQIILREIEGTFIPICTKNIFMKYYSDDVKDLEIWNESDRKSYAIQLKKVIKPYLSKDQVENEQ